MGGIPSANIQIGQIITIVEHFLKIKTVYESYPKD